GRCGTRCARSLARASPRRTCGIPKGRAPSSPRASLATRSWKRCPYAKGDAGVAMDAALATEGAGGAERVSPPGIDWRDWALALAVLLVSAPLKWVKQHVVGLEVGSLDALIPFMLAV